MSYILATCFFLSTRPGHSCSFSSEMSFLQPLARLVTNSCCRIGRLAPSRAHSSSVAGRATRLSRPLLWSTVAIASLGLSASTAYSDANVKPTTKTEESEDKVGESVLSLPKAEHSHTIRYLQSILLPQLPSLRQSEFLPKFLFRH